MERLNVLVVGSTVGKKDGSKAYAVYTLEITYKGFTWFLHKRFSQFAALNEFLENNQEKLPPFPPKKLFGSSSPNVCADRSEKLQEYLQKLVNYVPFETSLELAIFLEIFAKFDFGPKKRVLIPLPDYNFNVAEVAILWKVLSMAGVLVAFCTEGGQPARATVQEDDKTITNEVRDFFGQMEKDPSFSAPTSWASSDSNNFQGIILPGGHLNDIKAYLESTHVQKLILDFWEHKKPVAAIGHGILLLCKCEKDGKSILSGRKTTGPPREGSLKLRMSSRVSLASTEDTIKAALAQESDFVTGPHKPAIEATSVYDDKLAFVCEDGNYLSARGQGDAYLLGKLLVKQLTQEEAEKTE